MIDRIENHSKEQGFPRSRLPSFTTEEINRIRGTADFFGINSYTSVLVSRNDRNNSAKHAVPSFQHDMGVVEQLNENWPKSGSVWLRVSPALKIAPVPYLSYQSYSTALCARIVQIADVDQQGIQ